MESRTASPEQWPKRFDPTSVLAFEKLLDHEEAKRISVDTMIKPVAEALGNTVAMSRKAYVHPALIAAVKDNPRDPLDGLERPQARKWLSSCEVALIPFLKKVARQTGKAAA